MILLIANEKGGVGKTTLATNLAVLARKKGLSVVLVDADPLANSVEWWNRREEAGVEPSITCLPAQGKIGRTLRELGDKHDFVIVDSGGRDSVEVRQALAVCDMVLVPLRPSQNDIDVVARMEKLIVDLEDMTGELAPVRMLLSAVDTNPFIREADETRVLLKDFESTMPLLKAQVSQRVAFRKANRGGLGVVELPSGANDQKATDEIEALFVEVTQ